MSESFDALRRANPRRSPGFDQEVDTIVESVVESVRARLGASVAPDGSVPRRRLLRASAAGAALAVAGAVALSLTAGSPGGAPDAAAAVRKAARVSAASAERSGTAVVRIKRNGGLWAGKTIRWHGGDLMLSDEWPRRGKVGSHFLLVDGTMYGIEPERGWVVLGSPDSIDPDSGTTPAEYLAAVREDVGGVTLRRIASGMSELTTTRLEDGSTVYMGAVAAGLIARETGFKEGRSIRVLPFGYVAHDEAADSTAALEAAVTVGANGLIREIVVTWGGTTGPTWRYSVKYDRLGATAAPVAPANAEPLRRRLRADR